MIGGLRLMVEVEVQPGNQHAPKNSVFGTTGAASDGWSFATVNPRKKVWEFAALVTSLDAEILNLGQLYRDRADSENDFDELKNQWGWGGFTTQDLKRCRLMARFVALVFNWWTLVARLADPDHHREAITMRPLLLTRSDGKPAMPVRPPSISAVPTPGVLATHDADAARFLP